MHNLRTKHPLAGKTVTIQSGSLKGESFTVEDYWENVYGKSWIDSRGNPASMAYSVRVISGSLPIDDEVLYGKIKGLGILIHISEVKNVPTN